MQYHSPFKVLSQFLRQNESLQTVDFISLKKRILAEFELSTKTSIRIGDNEYSRNDILQLIDNIKHEKFFQYHLIIQKLPGLLSLLENNEIDAELSFYDPYYKNKGFITFLSPFLAKSLGLFIANQIISQSKNLNLGFHSKFPILEEHNYLLTEPVTTALNDIISKVKGICSDSSVERNSDELKMVFSSNIINTINLLPPFYFANQTETYAQCGIDLIHYLLKPNNSGKIYPKTAKHIRQQLLKLKLPEGLKATIEKINIENEEYYENITIEETQRVKISLKAKLIFIIVLFLIIWIAC